MCEGQTPQANPPCFSINLLMQSEQQGKGETSGGATSVHVTGAIGESWALRQLTSSVRVLMPFRFISRRPFISLSMAQRQAAQSAGME